MDLSLYLAFAGAATVLMLIPGPNVALILANTIGRGRRHGFLTVAGTSTAMAIQLALVVFGLTAVLSFLAEWFEWIRWIGVGYLLYLGISALRAPARGLELGLRPAAVTAIFGRAVVVSLTNPKTLLFYGAFFPQFVNPVRDADWQPILLAATFLIIAVAIDSLWVVCGARASGAFRWMARRRIQLSAGLYIASGLGLALARRGS